MHIRVLPGGPLGQLLCKCQQLAIALLAAWLIAACTRPAQTTPSPTPFVTPLPPILASLNVNVEPRGATIALDGVRRGSSPATIELPAGRYHVQIESTGYAPLDEIVELQPGTTRTIDGRLRDITAPEVQLEPTVVPAQVVQQPSPPASTPQATDLHSAESTITIPTYPYARHLYRTADNVLALDRAGYERSTAGPEAQQYNAVVLENRYLKLTFLPELGGRLYSCVFKPTDQEVFYHNPVLKPSYWGPLDRERNWWLAAGGMEWALPVQEHGHRWGVPWDYEVERTAQALRIILRDTGSGEGLRCEISVELPSERCAFTIHPRLVNAPASPTQLQFWINAMMTLGSPSTSPNTEFILPARQVVVHSTGDRQLPDERERMDWPVHAGRDLSVYRNWDNWLGVFVPLVTHDYVGAYNHDTNLGIARVFPAQVVKGVKLFAFGTQFPSRAEFTDNGSDYLELWGGPCGTFWPEDDLVLDPGETIEWSETWLPYAGIGGLDAATADVAVKTIRRGDAVEVALASTAPQRLAVSWRGDTAEAERWVQVAPGRPGHVLLPVPPVNEQSSPVELRIASESGPILDMSYLPD